MFGRNGNAKPSVAQASAWVTYLLVGIGIISPVVCVIWLVQKTVESENARVRELVEEARERTLADLKSLIELTARSMVPDQENGGARYALGMETARVAKQEWEQSKATLAEIRDDVSNLEEKEAQLLLAERLSNESVADSRFLGGRRLGPILVEMGLRRRSEGKGLEEQFRSAAENYFLKRKEELSHDRQLQYSLRKYAPYVKSVDVAALVAKQELVDRWLRAGEVAPGLSSGNGYFSVVGDLNREAYVFPQESLLVVCEELESLRNNRFKLSLASRANSKSAVRFDEPLGFLAIEDLSGDGIGHEEVSSEKAVFYVWIGGIVLGLSGLSGVAIVISIRRQASVTRLKDNLVATVTHELKTPVASIRLLVDTLLNEERRGKVDTDEYIELISRENQRLGRLIDNFLSFSRMERSKGSFDISPVSPEDIARMAEDAFRERFQGQRFSLDVNVARELPMVLGDADALSTVLGNLLENAFKYGGKEREIVLRARKLKDGVQFEVEDSGQGIPKREQKRIFRKFYQVDGVRGAQSGSVGLGLSIVDFVVSKHSGRVELESEEGVGSVFKVRIPYA